MMKLLSCRYNMDTAIQLFNVAATSLDCVSPIYYLYVALIFISLRFRNKTKVAGITMIPNHFSQVKELLSRTPYDSPELWLNPEKKHIEDFEMKDIKVLNYQHHGTIKAPVAV